MSGAVGVILAGGRSTRMGGGDKCLLALSGRPLLAQVIERFSVQVDTLVINANGDPARFAGFGLPVIADADQTFFGPLSGVLAGLDFAARSGAPDILTVAADTPFFPTDFGQTLHRARIRQTRPLAMAATRSGTGVDRHPTFALWPVDLREDLRAALAGGLRKIVDWTDRHGCALAEFGTWPFDPFFNINTPQDLARAEQMADEFQP